MSWLGIASEKSKHPLCIQVMSDNLRKRTSSGSSPTSKRNSSGGSAAGGGHARSRSDGSQTRSISAMFSANGAPLRSFASGSPKHTPKMIGDETRGEEGLLDDQIDMRDWEFLGPPGSYADGVFKGFQRSNLAEVAVKVVSTQNPLICGSQWVRDKLAELKMTSGKEVTDEQKLKVYEEKVLREMYNTQTLSSPYICEFFGCFRESTTYADKVVNKPDHAIHQHFRERKETERPYPHRSFFFVMENLNGESLHEYNASHNYGCGYLLAFEAAPQATESLIHAALNRFPPFPAAPDDAESKAYKDFMYLDDPFLHAHKSSRFLLLKFNTSIRHGIKFLFSFAQVQHFLLNEKLICNCAQKVQPIPLFFDETFIRKTLKHIIVALCHAHAAPIFHNDLKPDNIMFRQRVHAHATHDGSKICAKIIDWGCGGWSKESENEIKHPYKPPEEPPGEATDVFCVGNTLLYLFNGDEWQQKRASGNTLLYLFNGEEWQQKRSGDFRILPEKFTQPLKCPWNKNPDFQDLHPKFCVPWNPNEDKDFKDLVRVDRLPAQCFCNTLSMYKEWFTQCQADASRSRTSCSIALCCGKKQALRKHQTFPTRTSPS